MREPPDRSWIKRETIKRVYPNLTFLILLILVFIAVFAIIMIPPAMSAGAFARECAAHGGVVVSQHCIEKSVVIPLTPAR